MKTFYILVLLFSLLPVFAQTTIVLQPSAETGKDALLSSRHENQNIGNTTEFIAATWTFQGEVGIYRSLLEFDLSSIPSAAQITDAKLSLFHNDVSSSNGHAGDNATYLRRVIAPWNENTVTWNSQPGSTDIDQIVLAPSASEDQDYENIDVTTLVQGMHQDPAHNFGFQLILSQEAIYRSMKFYTSDAEEPSQRPKLVITYTTENTCVTLQPGAEGKDAVAWSMMPGTNIGNSPEFIAATWTFNGTTGHYRSYLEFDLSSIPTTAQLVSANLSLYHSTNSASNGHEGNNSSALRRVTESWEENSLTWNFQPSSTEAGEIILPISVNENENYEDFNVLSFVEDMVANPASNHGFVFRLLNEEIYRSMKFASGDYEDPGRHPKLDVCFTSLVANQEIDILEAEILPNPFSSSFVIRHLEGPYVVVVTDINGRIVYQENLTAQGSGFVVDKLYDLSSGMYFVRASGEKEYNGKVVKL